VNIWQSMRVALRGITANKLRAFLTMLGIIIGVGAVIALLSVGRGVQDEITRQLQSTGSNLITIVGGSLRTSGVRVSTSSSSSRQLTTKDAAAIIAAGLPEVAAVSPEFGTSGQVSYGNQSSFVQITGVTPDYQFVRNAGLAAGEFFDNSHIEGVAQVAVLGHSIAAALFGDEDPVGKIIKLNRSNYRVLGVLEERGGSSFTSEDSAVFVPLTTAQRRLIGATLGYGTAQRLSTIAVSAVNEASVDAAVAAIDQVLREQHRLADDDAADFTIISQKLILSVVGQVTGILTAFLGAIAAISLLVGGIGIMNIMLVSVTERTREIGIRMAIGARASDILTQFLVESVTLSCVGGLLGILLGMGLTSIISRFTEWQVYVSIPAMIIAVTFSAAVGIFFGLYPAWKASQLDPIEALRFE